jgi:spore coat polysaccharide biosynthesis protein SpsF
LSLKAASVVFARLDSRRLPGKALVDLGGASMLARVIDRVERAGLPVIVATSDRKMDEPIAQFAGQRRLACFRGDASDVGGRALACAREYELDVLVRISGDSPFMDPVTIDAVMRLFDTKRPDLATNLFPRTFPAGMSVEAISVPALDRAMSETDEADDHEHVTKYFYRRSEAFRIVNHAAPDGDSSGCHLTVDTPDDLAKARWLVSQDVIATTPRERVVALVRQYGRTGASPHATAAAGGGR